MHRVTFAPSGRAVDVDVESTLLSAARRAGVPLASSCRGAGICDACRVRVVEGGDLLSELTERERESPLGPGERLACQAVVLGPVTVTTGYW
jgi:2Fe-2S ferredoxin